jgi:hypothetical protein
MGSIDTVFGATISWGSAKEWIRNILCDSGIDCRALGLKTEDDFTTLLTKHMPRDCSLATRVITGFEVKEWIRDILCESVITGSGLRCLNDEDDFYALMTQHKPKHHEDEEEDDDGGNSEGFSIVYEEVEYELISGENRVYHGEEFTLVGKWLPETETIEFINNTAEMLHRMRQPKTQ